MTLTIEKVENGYIVLEVVTVPGEHANIHVFANLESALSFIKKEFGEVKMQMEIKRRARHWQKN